LLARPIEGPRVSTLMAVSLLLLFQLACLASQSVAMMGFTSLTRMWPKSAIAGSSMVRAWRSVLTRFWRSGEWSWRTTTVETMALSSARSSSPACMIWLKRITAAR
jgi:hypothetical protein